MDEKIVSAKRQRFVILDALRGIAGLSVPLFHLFEPLVGRRAAPVESIVGHGYLAVEFFLLLMGYMLGYAYDRRWQDGMGTVAFFKRRLVRLHPLVISGVLLGLVVVLAQPEIGGQWARWMKGASVFETVLVALWAMTMVPVVGYGMINPFNACSWTLYYEYAGNVLYALVIRRMGKRALAVGSLVAAFLWIAYVLHVNLNGIFGTHLALFDKVAANARWSIVCGWQDSLAHLYGGSVRLMFPLFFGLLLSRLGWRIRIPKVGLWIAVAVFMAVLFTPYSYRLGGEGHYWVNALFEAVALMVVFPLLILVGVGTPVEGDSPLSRAFGFLAELSYPLYMSHYMFMYVYGWWIKNRSLEHSGLTVTAVCVTTYFGVIFVAWLMMRYWDRPIQALCRRRKGR